ncbi:MAG: DNA polymerase III subunits gamma and tau (EC [uncultured Sulfurovum sp.]|uniref:DNA polymerase III subunit gamma/tau n=1 Tax=uncultured Sulfurovum sp. TaxID=269237 RepID=A0A6S6TEP6_9BACT|nr:MAG: DNA polymerase III subunits gamma and tau (EC [uncultured Sulfurovum sp.]
MSLALARKYRPSTFDDLIGQEAVSQTLSMALESDRLSHAYLFSGLRGSGKTSTARIFAKALLCEKGATSHPCGVCSHCKMAVASRHMDIIEMDAASNRKIDDIRELIEHTKYKPSTARYKIFIIDEVHMLTKEAFNALLKTLEEPPSFVKFILATTDPLKLPVTILSRTQHFRFRNIPQSVVAKHLAHILNLEGVEYEQNALDIIARSGAGSVRDALTLLDQAIVYSKNFINMVTITNMLGIIEPSMLTELLNDVLDKNQTKILIFINAASEFEAEMVIDELMLYLKELLLSGSSLVNPMIIERFFRVLAEGKTLLNMGSDGDFVLSLTLFKMMEALNIKEIDGMIRSLEKELSGVKTNVLSEPENNEVSDKITTTMIKNNHIEAKIEKEVIKPKVVKTLDHGEKLFEELVLKMYDRNYDLGECFKEAIIYVSFTKSLLTWESIANIEQKTLLKNNWMTIRTFVQELFGYETKIKNIVKGSPSPVKKKENYNSMLETSINIDSEEPTSMIEDEVLNQPNRSVIENHISESPEEEMKSSCISPAHGGIEAAKEKDERNILDEPMIAKALELFNPKTVRVKRK